MSKPKPKFYTYAEIHCGLPVLTDEELCKMEDKYNLTFYDQCCEARTMHSSNIRLNMIKIDDQRDAWMYLNRFSHDNQRRLHMRNNLYYYRLEWVKEKVGLEKFDGRIKYRLNAVECGIPERAPDLHPTISLEEQQQIIERYKAYRYGPQQHEDDEGEDMIVLRPLRQPAKPWQQPPDPQSKRSLKKMEDFKVFLQKQLYKTGMCHYHKRGLCSKGDECSYAHSESELRPSPKTLMCTRGERCPYRKKGNCIFKHNNN